MRRYAVKTPQVEVQHSNLSLSADPQYEVGGSFTPSSITCILIMRFSISIVAVDRKFVRR